MWKGRLGSELVCCLALLGPGSCEHLLSKPSFEFDFEQAFRRQAGSLGGHQACNVNGFCASWTDHVFMWATSKGFFCWRNEIRHDLVEWEERPYDLLKSCGHGSHFSCCSLTNMCVCSRPTAWAHAESQKDAWILREGTCLTKPPCWKFELIWRQWTWHSSYIYETYAW